MPKKNKTAPAPKKKPITPNEVYPAQPAIPAVTPQPQPQTGRRNVIKGKDFRSKFGL
jgi:hypothetical protein